MLCVYFTFLFLIYGVAAYFLLKPSVIAIPEADAEDRGLGLYCQPETLWNIFADVDQVNLAKPIDHWQLDAIIKALHKRGHVIMGPNSEEVQDAAAMLQDGRVWS